jgi:hypothetical protein
MTRINIQVTRFSAFYSPLIATAAVETVAVEREHFPEIDQEELASTIAAHQKLGNWPEHAEITREAFEVTLDVFHNVGRVIEGDAYARVAPPPPV